MDHVLNPFFYFISLLSNAFNYLLNSTHTHIHTMKKSSEFICVRFKRILRRKYCITLVQGGIRKRRRRRRRKKEEG